MADSPAIRFLGVGDASQEGLGHASACIELPARVDVHNTAVPQRLLIDLGPGVLQQYVQHYGGLPDAIFITHCHLDHIADFEKLFIKAWFSEPKIRPIVFVPVSIVALLHQRIATYPGVLAEGGVNFWQAFQLVPVAESFEYAGWRFHCPEVRHHRPNTAFALYLPEHFFYSGDTRPIPELLKYAIDEQCLIFHDCSVLGNPSHTGLDDIQREYDKTLQQRLYLYHYNRPEQRDIFEQAGMKCVSAGQRYTR